MKRSIKIIFTSACGAFAIFFMVIYISCTRDKCASVTCSNGGSCNNGICKCPSGYEGTTCQTLSRVKFIRNWGVENLTASLTEPAQFAVSIDIGTAGINYVSIKNLHDYFTTPVTAYVSGDSLIIPVQVVMGKTVTGSGLIYSSNAYGINNTISMSYQITDNTTHVIDVESETWHG